MVAGFARSGTSALARLLARAGRDPGSRLIPATPSNPTGFFESLDVNARNDGILGALAVEPGAPRPPAELRWLGAYVAPHHGPPADVADLVPPAPWVLKDPRFSFSYPAWRPRLPAHVVVVAVRHPGEVLASLDAMVRREPQTFRRWRPRPHDVLRAWTCAYRAIDQWADRSVVWVAYDSLRDPAVLAQLGAAVGGPLDPDLVDAGLRRSTPAPVPDPVLHRWHRLRARCLDAVLSP